MTDIDWDNPAEAALALARIVNTWRSHLERAQSCRGRAAGLRASTSPPPAGVSAEDWLRAPDLLDAQAADWDAAAVVDSGAFHEAAAQAVAGGRLSRAQAGELAAVASLDDAEATVAALKRDLF